MGQHFFIKRNVFTCITFGAVFLFVVAVSIAPPDNLPFIAFIVAVSVFFLSAFKLCVDVLEGINDDLTNSLGRIERANLLNPNERQQIRSAAPDKIDSVIEAILPSKEKAGYVEKIARSYYSAGNIRKRIRTMRRVFLYL